MEIPPFGDYLATVNEFLKTETKKFLEELAEEQNKPDILVPDDMPEQVAYELVYEAGQYEEHLKSRLGIIDEFENILLESFFVAIYGFLELQLMQRCRKLKQENKNGTLGVSDIRGEDTIDRAMKYLTKVQYINFSIDKHLMEWEKIRNYGTLRNCIVHNEGRVDEGFEEKQRKKLIRFINQKNSGLSISNEKITISKESCERAWKTIEEFLYLVSQAETQSKE